MNRNQKAQAKKDKRAAKATAARRGRAAGVMGVTEHSANEINLAAGWFAEASARRPHGQTGLRPGFDEE
jgi:hypothetical protein